MRRITLSLTIGWMLACSGVTGGADAPVEPTDDATDDKAGEEEEEEEEEKEEAKAPEEKILGSWQLVPGESAKRRYQIMRAAASGKDKAKEKLGDLDAGEKSLYEYYESKSADEKKSLLEYIEGVRSTRYIFEENTFQIEVDDNKIASGAYSQEDPTDEGTTVVMEAYGTTKWFVKWEGDASATVDVQMDGSDIKIEHSIKRR